MSLKAYMSKRDFMRTNEPSGSPRPQKSSNLPIFAVQKHNASHLHYDFRIEVDGVLRSWAVPKGPPLKMSEKRLAVATEDHPLEYAKFEGRIPEGEYGAGIVEIWDVGTYECERSIKSALRSGAAELILKGKRMKGRYALIRTKMGADKKNWLLIKMKNK